MSDTAEISALPTLKNPLPENIDQIIIDLTDKHYSTYKIAQLIGCNQSTIWRRLQKIAIKNNTLKDFKNNRADILANLHAKSLQLQDRVYQQFTDEMTEEEFASLSPEIKRALLHTAGINANNIHNQERLERGMSTQNIDNHAVIEDLRSTLGAIRAEQGRRSNTCKQGDDE